MVVGGWLVVVAGCTYSCGWWWQAVLVYSGGFGQFFFFWVVDSASLWVMVVELS